MSKIVDVVILEQDIMRYSQAYYEGHAEISDSEFDTMVDQLRALNPSSPVLSQIGWGYAVDDKKKISHIGPAVGSLDKIKHKDQKEPYKTHGKVILPKLDGGSIVLYYRSGELKEALTRGDGKRGMTCLNKMRYILPNVKVPKKNLISIRGEVIIPNVYHAELIQRDISNPRNGANGIINRESAGKDIELLQFIPYSIRIYDEVISKMEMIDLLTQWGFKRIPHILGYRSDDLEMIYNKWNQMIPIDGLVITSDDSLSGTKIENGAFSIIEESIAYKFESERAEAEVDSVRWQTGKTGRITPVIKLSKPISLSGVNVTKATAHNATQVKEKGIGAGAKITIERANEVIPYIVSVDKPAKAELPELCPICGKLVYWKNMDLVCVNPYCKTKQDGIITSILEVCGIPDGLGGVYLDKWIDGRKVNEFIDYANMLANGTLAVSEDVKGHYDKLILRLSKNITKKFREGFSYEEFWNMIGIPGLAEAHASKLADTNPMDFASVSDVVTEIKKVGSKVKLPVNVIEEMMDTYRMWIKAAFVLHFADHKARVATHMTIVITGDTSMVREELKKFLKDYGIEVKNSVSKNTNYLVCNQRTSSSIKYKKAQQLGIPIITEDTLMSMIGLD